jgi:hypothetical protein
MDQLQPWMQMVVDPILVPMVPLVLILPMDQVLTPVLMDQLQPWMQMVVDPMLMPMVPLVLILPMDQVLTPMLMAIQLLLMPQIREI